VILQATFGSITYTWLNFNGTAQVLDYSVVTIKGKTNVWQKNN
jgi:hypothetical protein